MLQWQQGPCFPMQLGGIGGYKDWMNGPGDVPSSFRHHAAPSFAASLAAEDETA